MTDDLHSFDQPGGRWQMLGPAEKMVANQLKEAIKAASTSAEKLVEILNGIDLDDIDTAMIDAKRKKAVIQMVTFMQGMAKNLGMAELTTTIVEICVKPQDAS